jgi:hypothetical protein
MDAITLTWDKTCQRWKKVYRGRVFCAARGVKKSDRTAYGQAVAQFQEWKVKADGEADQNKPHADQYHRAIATRQAMLDYLAREHEQAWDNPAIEITSADGKAETIYLPLRGATYKQEHSRLTAEVRRLKINMVHPTKAYLDSWRA